MGLLDEFEDYIPLEPLIPGPEYFPQATLGMEFEPGKGRFGGMRILPGAGHRQPCQLVKPFELLELFFGNFGFYGIEIEIKSLESN